MEKYTTRRDAFMNAIAKLDLSTLSAELQQEITILSQTLQGEVTEDNINQINKLVKNCHQLKKIYDAERLALKNSRHEQERNKGFAVTEDKPDPNDLGPVNVNPPTPPTPEKDTSKNPTSKSK